MFPTLQKEFSRKLGETPVSEREHLEVIFQRAPALDSLPLASLYNALNFSLSWVQTNALYELYRRRPAKPFLPQPGAVISLVGTSSWPTHLLEGPLTDAGMRIAPFSEASTHVVLGFSPGPIDPTSLQGKILLMEEELLPLLSSHASSFLLHGERSTETGNLRKMLLTGDKQNALLALGLIEKGGLPVGWLTDLFALWRSRKPAQIPRLAGTLLKRFATGPLKENLLRRYFAFVTGDHDLLRVAQKAYDPEGKLDLHRYFRLNFQLSKKHDLSSDLLVAFHKGFKGIDSEEKSDVVEHMVKDMRLKLPASTLEFPMEVYQVEGLKSLELRACPIPSLPEGISQLRSLIKVKVDCPLKHLPSDLSQMRMLRSVALHDTQFDSFPDALLQLPNLKFFTWVRGLSDKDRTLQIPPAFFKPPLNSLHLSEERIELAEACFELETLQSLTIPLRVAKPHLEKIAAMSGLKRLQFELDPDEARDDHSLTQALPTWQLKDKKYNSRTFVRL